MVSPTVTALRERFRSRRISKFTESVIREMTRLALHHGAINLAQGFPDFPAPAALKQAAADAIDADINQYAITWGAKPFRDAIAAKYQPHLRHGLRPRARNHGLLRRHRRHGRLPAWRCSTPATRSSCSSRSTRTTAPIPSSAAPSRATSHCTRPIGRSIRDELRRAFTPRTKAIILNSPNNPTGKVFTRDELEYIAGLCQEFDALAITDEIYEHIVYDGATHIPISSLPGHARALDPGQQHE